MGFYDGTIKILDEEKGEISDLVTEGEEGLIEISLCDEKIIAAYEEYFPKYEKKVKIKILKSFDSF